MSDVIFLCGVKLVKFSSKETQWSKDFEGAILFVDIRYSSIGQHTGDRWNWKVFPRSFGLGN